MELPARLKWLVLALTLGVAAACYPQGAAAATPPKKVVLSPSQIFQRYYAGNLIVCGQISARWIPGVRAGGSAFISHKAQLAALQKDLLKARGSKAKAAVRAKITSFDRREKKEAPGCRSGPPATPTPTAAPTATPAPSPGCYNIQGDTSCFGIHEGITGNIDEGQALFQSSCGSCHDGDPQPEYRNRTYTQTSTSFSAIPSMNLYVGSFSATELADLVAYLNRYNPNQ